MRSLLLGVLMMAFCLRVDAQDELTMPPILNSVDVFVDDVEIIETLPELIANENNGGLYYLAADSEKWELLSPPGELSGYIATERLRNGNFTVFEVPHDMAGPCPPLTPTFEFNPRTQQFIRQEQEIIPPDTWRYWIISSASLRLVNLCQNVTGTEPPADISAIVGMTEWVGWYYPHGMRTPDYFIVPTPIPNDDGNYLFAIYTIADDIWSESFPLSLSGEWTFSELAFEDDTLYFVASGETGATYYALDIASRTFSELFRTSYPQLVLSKPGANLYHYIGYDDTDYQIYRYDLFSQHGEIIAEFPCAVLTDHCTELYISGANWWSEITNLMFVLRGSETERGFPHFIVYSDPQSQDHELGKIRWNLRLQTGSSFL